MPTRGKGSCHEVSRICHTVRNIRTGAVGQGAGAWSGRPRTVRDMLDEGYARGEIDSKEYLRHGCERMPCMSQRRTVQVLSRDV